MCGGCFLKKKKGGGGQTFLFRITPDGFYFLPSLTQKEHVSSGGKNIPITLCLQHLQSWSWRLGQRKPQLWNFALAPSADAQADGRAGISCRKAADLQCESRVKGRADIAEMAGLIVTSAAPGSWETNSPTLCFSQKHDGWCACSHLRFLCSLWSSVLTGIHLVPCLEIGLLLFMFQMLRKAFLWRLHAKIQGYSE